MTVGGGETAKDVSALTVDVLASHLDERAEHFRELRAADKEIAAERERHWRELREADVRYQALQQLSNDAHFAQLNENAKRTIEERGHFLSVEAFEPFRDTVTKQLAAAVGQSRGLAQLVGWLFGAVGLTIAAVSLLTR